MHHVLNPGTAIWHLHIHPVDSARLIPALPCLMKTQYVTKETVFRGAIMHDEAGMSDISGNLSVFGVSSVRNRMTLFPRLERVDGKIVIRVTH